MKPILILAVLFTFLILPQTVFAVTVSVSNTPSQVDDQPFSFDVSVQGAQADTNYLKANFFQPETTSYFGYTFNGTSFVNSTKSIDYSQYLPITIDSSGNWSGQVQAKLDTSSNHYSGPGIYSFKVRRYTSSGSTITSSNEISITVNLPTPTPTTTPNPSPTNPSSEFNISSDKSSIKSSDILSVNVRITGLDPNSKYYLKGVFIKSGSSNYFGLTKVSSDWVKNSASFSDQFPFTTDSSGNWNGQIQVMVDSEDSGFTGSGDYNFKFGKYTASGSGPTWSSNEATINITDNTTTSRSTSNSTPKPSSLASVKPYTSTNNSVSDSNPPKINRSIPDIAGIATQSSEPALIESDKQTPDKQHQNFWLLGAGFLVLTLGTVVLFYPKLQQKGIIIPWFSIQNLLQRLKVLHKN